MSFVCGSAEIVSVGKLLADVVAMLDHAIDQKTKKLGISGRQWVVLLRIGGEKETTASELCRAMGYDSGSMTRMLDRLEGMNLIVRERCADDRRVVSLALAETGRSLYKELCPIVDEVLNEHLKTFTSLEYEQLRGFLLRILSAGKAG